jgi:hypothetical protein
MVAGSLITAACAASGSSTPSTTPGDVSASPSRAATASASPVAAAGTAHVLDVSRVASGVVTVPAGQTMTIRPGSHLRFGSGASLRVAGTLVVAGPVTLTGSGWAGVVVAGGGTLDLAQAAIDGATNPITVTGGAHVLLTDVTISGESSPFTVAQGGSLSLDTVTVARARAQSSVDGDLHATALNYDKGAGEGFTALKGTARVTIANSVLHGDGPSTGDMLSMRSGDSLTVTNTEITGEHCAFHLVGLNSLALDHANIHGNSYGFMMYQTSTTGTRVIKNSNIVNNRDYGIDEGSRYNTNGPITVENTYIAHNGKDVAVYTHAITISNPATSPIRIP